MPDVKSFEQTLTDRGIPLPGKPIEASGFTRWGKNSRHSAIAIGDGFYVKDFSEDKEFFWFPRESKELSAKERREREQKITEAREKAAADRQQEYEKAASEASKFWQGLSDSGTSEYIKKKGIAPHGIRYGQGFITIPARDITGKLWSLQKIFDDAYCPEYLKEKGANKGFFPGGKITGCFHTIGELESTASTIICEGFATAASIYEAIGKAVIITFSAGNIEPVIASIRQSYPGIRITIAADNDIWGKNNTGKKKAEAAAKKHGCKVIYPRFKNTSNKPTDFNDLHILEGLEAVKSQLNGRLKAVTLHELMETEFKPQEWILEPIIPKQGLAMLYAYRGVGKTFCSLGIGYAVATGSTFLKWKAEKARKVLIVDGEMPARTLQDRLVSLITSKPWEDYRVYKRDPDEKVAIKAILKSLAPQDTTEGMLAAQITAIHNASMECLYRGTLEHDKIENRTSYLNTASKLSRTFIELMKALNHHRGKGAVEQKITVQYVNVADGAQAVVGNINHSAKKG